eukprot:m.67856 g.67856  ORF g.67856 m.67856 type:complete len:494 (-) comp8473_c0_seq1:2178-3659(-)
MSTHLTTSTCVRALLCVRIGQRSLSLSLYCCIALYSCLQKKYIVSQSVASLLKDLWSTTCVCHSVSMYPVTPLICHFLLPLRLDTALLILGIVLGLHYATWYYDVVLSAMAGDRSDPEIAMQHCRSNVRNPALARFWAVMAQHGGPVAASRSRSKPLEQLDLDTMLAHARDSLLTSDGRVAIDAATRRHPDRIPPRVHQTYTHILTPEEYPYASKGPAAWAALAKAETGGMYTFWDDRAADAFLEAHFHSDVTTALRTLVPGAFKADLFRYCVMYVRGGVYADIDVRPRMKSLSDLLTPGTRLITPKQDGLCRCGLWQGFLAASPGHPVLLLAILLIVAQTEARMQPDTLALTFCPGPVPPGWDYDTHLYLTGPDLVGRALSTWLKNESCGTLTPSLVKNTTMGQRSYGYTHLLRQKGRVITMGTDDEATAREVADTPVLPDLAKRGSCPRYRWLWHTRRAYTDTGRLLGLDVRALLDAVGCTIGAIGKVFGL